MRVLISSLSTQQILALQKGSSTPQADPTSVLLAYVTFSDQRGGGIETSFKGDKQGLGLTKRNKKRGSRATHAGAARARWLTTWWSGHASG